MIPEMQSTLQSDAGPHVFVRPRVCIDHAIVSSARVSTSKGVKSGTGSGLE